MQSSSYLPRSIRVWDIDPVDKRVSGIHIIILSKSWEKVSCVPNFITYSDLISLDHRKILADSVRIGHKHCRPPQFDGRVLAPEPGVYIWPWVSGK